MQPFNLDRFKAGEPAYYKTDDHDEFFYLAEMPDGKIAVKYVECGDWLCDVYPKKWLKNELRMKEKELTWDELWKMWATGKSDYQFFHRWLDENFEAPKRKNK
jgi:hypothetical protein